MMICPRGLNKGFDLKFTRGYQLKQIPEKAVFFYKDQDENISQSTSVNNNYEMGAKLTAIFNNQLWCSRFEFRIKIVSSKGTPLEYSSCCQ